MENLLPDIKKSVSFVFVPDDKGNLIAQGTGFFMGVRVNATEDLFNVCFVTAKHVLQNAAGQPLSTFYLRLTKLTGDSDVIQINTKDIRLIEHADPDIDLIAFPLLPDRHHIDFKFIPSDMITAQQVREGQDVFFSGLFLSHVGQKKNQPIIRFGKVALISDEKIEWREHNQTKWLDLYLLECQSFAGNSGSPVFFQAQPGGPIFLAGVMKGSFMQANQINNLNNEPGLISFQNIGIAAVTPASKLHDLLFSQQRDATHAKD
jgi:hypothetical protein